MDPIREKPDNSSSCFVFGTLDFSQAEQIGNVDPISTEDLKYPSCHTQSKMVQTRFEEFCVKEQIQEFPNFSREVKKIELLLQRLNDAERLNILQPIEGTERVKFIKIHHQYIHNPCVESANPLYLDDSYINIPSRLRIKTHEIISPLIYKNIKKHLTKEQIQTIFNTYLGVINAFEQEQMWNTRLLEFVEKYNRGTIICTKLLIGKWD